jgi:hypothetical protein
MDPILIYTSKKTGRVRYVFRMVFEDILKFNHKLTTDLEEFLSSDLPKFMYCDEAHSDDLFFKSSGLLFTRGIELINLEPFDFDGSKAFFPVYDKHAALPFDIFSSIFYLVSRYEEYLPFVKDRHGRYTAHLSISAKLHILNKPIVNIWALKVKEILLQKYPVLKFPKRKYKFIPTYDIDSAYAYAQKGLVRTVGGYLMSLWQMKWGDIAQRTRVMTKKEKDPFNTFDLQIQYQKEYKLKPIYFFLFAHYGQYDKNINTRNSKFRFLVKSMGDYASVGIHPSYNTIEHPELLKKEIRNLRAVLNKDVTCSRQHFLRIVLPSTYRNLIEHDITDDYSMGYAALPGFRAGICTPFNFYDLDLEIETKLRIHPFAVMDGTLNDYLGLTPADAIDQIKSIIREVKKVDGTFISLWHNESLSDQKRWKGWKRVYEQLIKEAIE